MIRIQFLSDRSMFLVLLIESTSHLHYVVMIKPVSKKSSCVLHSSNVTFRDFVEFNGPFSLLFRHLEVV